jgi:acetyltransferase-like isoleucine patch superfamily enzyme
MGKEPGQLPHKKKWAVVLSDNVIADLLIMCLPSIVKILIYRLKGAKIGKGCYIGFSLIGARDFQMADFSYIGHFNLIWRLKCLEIGRGARISLLNWITGGREGTFRLGNNSSVSVMHFLEASADILIGSNTIVAGRASQFFTHGISATNLDDKRAIHIGNWCYIGSAARFTPGSAVADGTFVGMGAVVTRSFDETFVLIGGSPARHLKKLSGQDVYFDRPFMSHAHHPKNYEG